MYLAIVASLMMIFPAGSIGLEAASANAGVSAALVANVFWAVGARLSLAGMLL